MNRRALILCGLLAAFVLGSGLATAAVDVTITSVQPEGEGLVTTEADSGRTYLWRDDPFELQITLEAPSDGREYEICADAGREAATTRIACRTATVSGTETVTLAADGWPANASGRQTLQVSVRPVDGGDAAVRNVTVHTIARGGDFDRDGLSNREELDAGTSIGTADTDGDSVSDGREVNTYGTDPRSPDTDGDGLDDGVEIHTHGTNPTVTDTDGDELPDGAEVHEHETVPNASDTDGDGLDDGREIRAVGTNPNKPDTDGDGLTDGAEVNVHDSDPRSVDTDGDGLDDGAEVSTYETNPNDPDTDGDGLDDGTEVNVYGSDPLSPDSDGDGLDDGTEVERGTDPTGDRGPVERLLPDDRVDRALTVAVALGTLLAILGLGYLRPFGSSSPDPSDPDDPDETEEPETTGAGAPQSDLATDLVDDDDRVMQLLHTNDGRIRQSRIVEMTDWSKSKTSRVLSEMVDEGAVRKVTIGRENLIVLPGEMSDLDPQEDDG